MVSFMSNPFLGCVGLVGLLVFYHKQGQQKWWWQDRRRQGLATEILLGIFCLGMVAHYFTTGALDQHPASSMICMMILLHFWNHPQRSKNKLHYRRIIKHYALQPRSVYKLQEYYRIFTGQMLHQNTLHLYLTLCSFVELMDLDRKTLFPGYYYYALFLFSMMLATGVCFVLLVYTVAPPKEKRAYAVIGFSGVVFALKTFRQAFSLGFCSIGVPVCYGTGGVTLSIPFLWIPKMIAHWCELFLCLWIFPRSSCWGHLAGILAGYMFAIALRGPDLVQLGVLLLKIFTER